MSRPSAKKQKINRKQSPPRHRNRSAGAHECCSASSASFSSTSFGRRRTRAMTATADGLPPTSKRSRFSPFRSSSPFSRSMPRSVVCRSTRNSSKERRKDSRFPCASFPSSLPSLPPSACSEAQAASTCSAARSIRSFPASAFPPNWLRSSSCVRSAAAARWAFSPNWSGRTDPTASSRAWPAQSWAAPKRPFTSSPCISDRWLSAARAMPCRPDCSPMWPA